MALLGGLYSAEAMKVNGPPYWDNALLGFEPSSGTYDNQPGDGYLNQ